MLENQLKRKEVSIGERKDTSIFYSDIVSSSIGKETLTKIFAIEYSAGKYNEPIVLNNFKKGPTVEIKQHHPRKVQKPVKKLCYGVHKKFKRPNRVTKRSNTFPETRRYKKRMCRANVTVVLPLQMTRNFIILIRVIIITSSNINEVIKPVLNFLFFVR